MNAHSYKTTFSRLDLRVRLLIMVLVSINSLILQTEAALLVVFLSLCLWLWLFGLKRQVVTHILWYVVLLGSLYLLRYVPVLGSTALPLITVYARRIMLPVMAAQAVTAASNGQLIASLNRMKCPKALTLSLAILFRFLPTIHEEYSHIRDAQKFRGIGTSAISVLCHPFAVLEYTLIPMLIRTSKIADELSASASVRGVKLKGQSSSWHTVQMRAQDWLLGAAGIAVLVCALCVDRMMRGQPA